MTGLPDRETLLAFLRENPGRSEKREIARAFGLKGADRIALKAMLRALQDEGALVKDRGGFRESASLPPVAVLVVLPPDSAGEAMAAPLTWEGAGPAPRIRLLNGRGDRAVGEGDRVLARIRQVAGPPEPAWEAQPIRRIGSGPRRILGIYRRAERGGRIEPVERKGETEWLVAPGDAAHAQEGELVEAEALGRPDLGLPKARVILRLGDPSAPRAVSLIAIHAHGIPTAFSEEALAEAEAAGPADATGREDLRGLPLVTIDPEDARDRDDAVAAAPDPDPGNPGGFVLWVAIADVAAYVRPGSALDREARARGNSTYFPDRVVPMLPEALSGDLCSLHEGVDRPCLAVRMVIGADGRKRGHRFTRGLMRSRAAFAYEAVQAAAEGRAGPKEAPLVDAVIAPLYACYRAVRAAREIRQPLDLDLPERRIVLSPEGKVVSVAFRERFDAHRLIEEFMILANVAAAETLEERRSPLLYRVHEEPSPDKVEALREIAEGAGLTLPKGQVLKTAQFNRLLAAARETEVAEMLHLAVLRTQTQAYYAPENLAHFGLNLRRYAHFTSPIRRYADLVVHRALVSALGLGAGGLSPQETERLAETAKHVSMTERRSMEAERDTTDRYLAAFLADRVGSEFEGRVTGVARFGVFVKLDGTGADGLIPVSTLGREFFHHDAAAQTLTGEQSGRVIGIGMRATVRLAEASPVTGGLLLELLAVEGKAAGGPARPRSRGPMARKLVKARIKQARRPNRRP